MGFDALVSEHWLPFNFCIHDIHYIGLSIDPVKSQSFKRQNSRRQNLRLQNKKQKDVSSKLYHFEISKPGRQTVETQTRWLIMSHLICLHSLQIQLFSFLVF